MLGGMDYSFRRHVRETWRPLLATLLLISLIPACAELASLLGVAAPVAAQVAGGALSAAVASARASGQLPADPAVEALEARLAALEAAERADRACPADAGAPPPLDARTVAELLDREAAARVAAAEERRAIAGELRALLARPVASALPSAPVLPMADAGAVDAAANGGM